MTHVWLINAFHWNKKFQAQFIYLGKFGFFEECLTKYSSLNLQLFYPSYDFLKIRLKQVMALSLEERSLLVFHYKRNEHLNELSCFADYRPFASLVIMKEWISYRVHHINVMISIDGNADDDNDSNDGTICIVTHLRIILIRSIIFWCFL